MRIRVLCTGVVALVLLLVAPASIADTLQTVKRQITSSSDYETTPSLGNDGVQDIVVYTSRALLNGGILGAADIWYQPLVGGAPAGGPVQVTFGDIDEQLNDVSGDYIVYTAYDSVTANSGAIVVYQISTGVANTIATATIIQEPKIHGDRIIWRQGGAFAAEVMYFEIPWIAHGFSPRRLAGPVPPTFDIQIGSRYAVWAELDGTYDVHAYDFDLMAEVHITNTPALNERQPATTGDWIIWQQQSGLNSTIDAKNMVTQERITIDNGASNYNPSADGDLIAWETDVAGNLDVWLYRISNGESYAVTDDLEDQYLTDVFGNLVAYVDMSGGSEDIYVSTLEFISDEPVARAGPDQSVHIGSLVTLDGTGSYDPDGDYPLSFEWQLYNFGLAEPNITDLLSPSANDPTPSFTAYLATDYTAYLGVIDSDGDHSEVDIVTISTTNSRPVADAGADQSIDLVGTIVTLDGTQSYDDDGDPLNYAWSLTARPSGSVAALINPLTAIPSFTADVNGEYRATLVVNDGWADSAADETTVSFDNVAPVADAGGNQVVAAGATVTLSGGGTDANGDPLTYQWSFVSWPDGTPPALQGATNPTASFVADTAGDYVVSLVVNDGTVDSEPDNANVLATLSQDQIVEELDQSIEAINALPTDVFKNKNMARTLTNKLLAVIGLIESGDYVQARSKLVNDVMGKTDGCALSGTPDRNDWIKTCEAQDQVYSLLLDILTMLDDFIGP